MSDVLINNPIVYHLITDRFYNGKKDHSSYPDEKPECEIGGFHGGNISGVVAKVEEGWFSELGINAILISAPYEQIRGWIPGGDGVPGGIGEFKHYAYHGYYALDYTVMEPRFGAPEDLVKLVEVCHHQGIRVLLDIVLNHPGYPDLATFSQLNINALKPNWEKATPENYFTYFDLKSPEFQKWWGGEWVRGSYANYPKGGEDELTMLLSGLPDFRTESSEHVNLPDFLKKKPDTLAIDLPNTTVRGYLITWLTDWVRKYGIDGFRCDSAKHVELDAWLELKVAAQQALDEWRRSQPTDILTEDAFWMTGEVFDQGVERNYYYDFGFDNLINFHFQRHLKHTKSLDVIYRAYSKKLSGRPGYNVLSYISSHDTFLYDRESLIEAGTALLLAPGGILIFYGDESARPPGPFTSKDPFQATRSYMNWDSIDKKTLTHWRKLGKFRKKHTAIARGTHTKLSTEPYVFSRNDDSTGDRVVIAIGVNGEIKIPVGHVFKENEVLYDAYTGNSGRVESGHLSLHAGGIALLESSSSYLTDQ